MGSALLAESEAGLVQSYREGAPIHVIATTRTATRAAIGAAAMLANALKSRIRIIAAREMPSEWSSGQQSAPVRAFAQAILDLPEVGSAEVDVLPCVCRRLSDVVQLLGPKSVVVIGGRSFRWCRWWPSREQRLAHLLTDRGCQVLFVHSAG